MISDFDEIVVAQDLDFAAANDRLYGLGATDGLPVVPPTRARIEAMLGDRNASLSVGRLPPVYGDASLFKLAACAVMAGCTPDYFPVLIAAVEGVVEKEFNLLGVQTTTGTAAAIMIVNGPVVSQLGINAGSNSLGPGARANATIGRALALVLRDVGGAIPGE